MLKTLVLFLMFKKAILIDKNKKFSNFLLLVFYFYSSDGAVWWAGLL